MNRHYRTAYLMFSDRFRSRVSEQRFIDLWSQINRSEAGGVKSMEWNGHIDFTTDTGSGRPGQVSLPGSTSTSPARCHARECTSPRKSATGKSMISPACSLNPKGVSRHSKGMLWKRRRQAQGEHTRLGGTSRTGPKGPMSRGPITWLLPHLGAPSLIPFVGWSMTTRGQRVWLLLRHVIRRRSLPDCQGNPHERPRDPSPPNNTGPRRRCGGVGWTRKPVQHGSVNRRREPRRVGCGSVAGTWTDRRLHR